MAHINLKEGPGIIGPLSTYPNTAKPLSELADSLLVKETASFPKGERETIASYVSYLNDCVFCSESHGAAADFHLDNPGHARKVWTNLDDANISDKLRFLLRIAEKVQKGGKKVLKTDVEDALKNGASEDDVHDTVLIAAAFCMYNRYVDGLGTDCPPREHKSYEAMGKELAKNGYLK